MKLSYSPSRRFLLASFLIVLVSMLASIVANAHPYAANVAGTNAPGNGVGIASFILNETADDVTIIYDPGLPSSWTNDLGPVTVVAGGGLQQFLFPSTNASFEIICKKAGSGLPSLISSDTFSNSVWGSPRGIAVNKNAANGTNFGRIYVGNSAVTGSGATLKGHGLYCLNADLTDALGQGQTAFGQGSFAGSGASGPFKIRVNDDGTVLVTDASTAAAAIYQFSADLRSSNLVLSVIGQAAGISAGTHSDPYGTPKMVGSLAQGNLVLFTADPDLGASGDTNSIKGPLTGPGSFNCINQFNIGAGPIPASGWSKRPDFSYTLGLDGLALFLNTEVDIGKDGKIIGSFGRANASNPNIQILRPFQTTNGITGDLFNKAVQDAASDKTNWLYTGGVTPPFNSPPNGGVNGDPWVGINGSGSTSGGSYSGVRVSPDGIYLASVDIGNGATIASLTNGIPNEGTIFGINPANLGSTTTGNSRGMDWDPADNLWIASSGQGLIRCYSLGLTTTCITSNDWTAMNGSFQLILPPVQAGVAVINANGTQNYTNTSPNGGIAKPAVLRISLNSADTTALGPTFVGFVRTGPNSSDILGNINLTAGGSGYTAAPTVAFSASGATYGATAVASISGGVVTNITITHPGAGYTATPTITFSGGGGSGATATAVRGLDVAEYTINTNELPNGVTVKPNGVLFPAGVFAGSNGPNWNVDVKFTPTQYPISGPTYTLNIRLLGGTNYSTVAPFSASVALLNTGPQLLRMSAAAPSTLGAMSRSIQGDSCRFVLTRWGDTNGPSNDAVNPIVARNVSLTNFNYFPPATGSNFMAVPGVDFNALVQKFTGAAPANGTSPIVVNPGDVTVTGLIGNPVRHAPNQPGTNATVFINLTNLCSGTCSTNLTESGGKPYQVTAGGLTFTLFDNARGNEVVLWSNPLTNSLDSTNWTVVYASILSLDTNGNSGSPTLPTVITNYDNSHFDPSGSGANFTVAFGKAVNDPSGDSSVIVPPSPTMAANSWSNALKLTVNKNPSFQGEAGVNIYPQIPGILSDSNNIATNFMVFNGNYALRFDMFLSIYSSDIGNVTSLKAREYAAFGINHRGTNANWRLDVNPRADGTGARPINSDGEWCAIDAASGAVTPADYDMFIPPPFAAYDTNGAPLAQVVPYSTNLFTIAPLTNAYQSFPGVYANITNFFGNNGVPNDQVSANNNQFGGAPQNGIIKNPPFVGINGLGGAPDNNWVDVSLEVTRQTNLVLKMAQQTIFNSSTTNGASGVKNVLAPFSGTPMLGYLDPNINISDDSAFVYYSNMRLVELSPFIPWTNQPVSGLIVTQGSTITISSGAMFASNPLTNTWYVGNTNGAFVAHITNAGVIFINPENGALTTPIITNVFNATSAVTNLTVTNIQAGTNYYSKWSDQAGSVTNWNTIVTVVSGPGNKTNGVGSTANLAVTGTGVSVLLGHTWKFFGTNLFNPTKYSGTNAASLFITNVQPADAGIYSNVVVNAYGSVVAVGSLTVLVPPASATVTPSATNVPWGSTVTLSASVLPANVDLPLTYQWKKGGANLPNGGNVSGATSSSVTIANVNQTTYGGALNSYAVGVTNGGGGVLSSAGTITVVLLPHDITSINVTSTNITMSFVSSNSFDTASAFTLQSAGVVTGPYTNDPSAVIIPSGGGFQVTATNTGSASIFYRLFHSN